MDKWRTTEPVSMVVLALDTNDRSDDMQANKAADSAFELVTFGDPRGTDWTGSLG